MPLTSLEVSQVSCCSRQLAASPAQCPHRHYVCKGELRQSWVWEAEGGEQRLKCKECKGVSELQQRRSAGVSAWTVNHLSRSVQTKQTHLSPTDTQATLAAQLSWVSLTQSVVHSQENCPHPPHPGWGIPQPLKPKQKALSVSVSVAVGNWCGSAASTAPGKSQRLVQLN